MTRRAVPGLTACGSCAGETLGGGEAARLSQLGRYAALEAGGCTRLTQVECLDQCGRGDAVVVRPVRALRATAQPVWLAGLTSPESVEALREWLTAGGPGGADLPDALVPHVVPPPG